MSTAAERKTRKLDGSMVGSDNVRSKCERECVCKCGCEGEKLKIYPCDRSSKQAKQARQASRYARQEDPVEGIRGCNIRKISNRKGAGYISAASKECVEYA